MKGQISIDYIGGAIIFFAAIVFLASSILGAMPGFSGSQQRAGLEMTAWTLSEVMLSDTGFWRNGTANGTDWQRHPANTTVVGLRDGQQLSEEKLAALLSRDYEDLRDRLDINDSFSVAFRLFVPADTHRTYEPGAPPGYITEPDSYASNASVQYGSVRVDGRTRRLLLTNELGWYNKLRISPDWNFNGSDVRVLNLTQTRFVQLGTQVYRLEAAHTDVSDGRLVIFERGLGRIGGVPGDDVNDIVSITRFGTLNDNIVRMEMQVWE